MVVLAGCPPAAIFGVSAFMGLPTRILATLLTFVETFLSGTLLFVFVTTQ
jgi:hypothetical protein